MVTVTWQVRFVSQFRLTHTRGIQYGKSSRPFLSVVAMLTGGKSSRPDHSSAGVPRSAPSARLGAGAADSGFPLRAPASLTPARRLKFGSALTAHCPVPASAGSKAATQRAEILAREFRQLSVSAAEFCR